MGQAQGKSYLRQSIAEILGTAEVAVSSDTRPGPFRRSLIYSSMALLAINPAQVGAVGLGELNVHSHLNQPLSATVPITLAAGESLPKNCVAPTRGSNGFNAPKNIRISTPAATLPGTYNLRVTTTNALYEPMYEISLMIDCPGTPLLVRQYVLMLDPPGLPSTGIDTSRPRSDQGDTLTVPTVIPQTVTQSVNQARAPATNQRSERSLQQSRALIPAGKTYRVRSGDTLSTIAARIDGRAPDTTWSVANLLFATNSHAFIRNNPNLIKLGALIDIPAIEKLAGLKTGRVTVTSSAITAPASAQPETIRESLPTPLPAPVPMSVAMPAAKTRPDVVVTEPEVSAATPLANESVIRDTVSATEAEAEAIPAQPLTTSTLQEDKATVITPFLDEQPVAPAATVKTVDTFAATPQPMPVITSEAQNESVNPVSPLVAALIGILLGLMISMVLFRRNLSAAVRGLLRNKTPVNTRPRHVKAHAQPPVGDYEDPLTSPQSAFDPSAADTAFETQQEESEPLPIGNPAENTYIVETGPAGLTTQIGTPDDTSPSLLDTSGESQQDTDESMLAQLFDEGNATPGEAESNIFDPASGHANVEAVEIFDATTAEMPQPSDDQLFDPTQELPTEFDGDIFDPTVEMPADMANELIGDTVDVPVDADELFAVGNDLLHEYDDSPTAEMQNDLTAESELNALPSDDEDAMAKNLQDALTLLERDFEDEFMASQIIESSEIKRSFDKTNSKDAEDIDIPESEVSD